MNSTVRVGLVVAMTSEAQLLTPRHTLRRGESHTIAAGVQLHLCGMGPAAAEAAAVQLLAEGADALAVFGVAGGLDPRYRAGDLICASEVISASGQRYATDRPWAETLQRLLGPARCQHASILGSPVTLTSAAAKRAATERYQAAAVDMESAAVAAIAQQQGAPLLVLRAIADEATDSLPAALQDAVDAFGQPRPWAMCKTLLSQPGLIPSLPGLARRMRDATRALQTAVTVAGADLGYTQRSQAAGRH